MPRVETLTGHFVDRRSLGSEGRNPSSVASKLRWRGYKQDRIQICSKIDPSKFAFLVGFWSDINESCIVWRIWAHFRLCHIHSYSAYVPIYIYICVHKILCPNIFISWPLRNKPETSYSLVASHCHTNVRKCQLASGVGKITMASNGGIRIARVAMTIPAKQTSSGHNS